MEQAINKYDLGTGDTTKLLLKYSLPAILGMIVNALYNIVDKFYVGQSSSGMEGMTALQLCSPIMMIAFGFAMISAVGGAARMSIFQGQGRRDMAEKTLGTAITMAVVVGATISLICFLFMDKILFAFGADATILPVARDYLSVITLGYAINFTGFALNRFIMSQGHPTKSMLIMLASAILNMILDPIFIFNLGMGVKGAAVATVISQALALVLSSSMFLRGKIQLKLKFENLKPKFELIKYIVSIGISPCLLQVFFSGVSIVINKSLYLYGGNEAVAAMSAAIVASSIMVMPIFGLNQGSQPLISFNFGAQKYKRMKDIVKKTLIFQTAILLFGYIIIMLFPSSLVYFFTSGGSTSGTMDPQKVFELSKYVIVTYNLVLPVVSVAIFSSNYFQSIGKAKKAIFFTLLRQVFILLPLILIFGKLYGVYGVWSAEPISDTLSFIICSIALYVDLKGYNGKDITEIQSSQESKADDVKTDTETQQLENKKQCPVTEMD